MCITFWPDHTEASAATIMSIADDAKSVTRFLPNTGSQMQNQRMIKGETTRQCPTHRTQLSVEALVLLPPVPGIGSVTSSYTQA